jgi:hypothetical protein
MKVLTSLAALCLAALPGFASANCYFVFSAQNQLVYRSVISPVDLSHPISDGLRGRFANGHLTMIPDETGCPDLLASGESQVFASFGFSPSAGPRPTSAIDASPLFRDADSAGAGAAPYSQHDATPADGSRATPKRAAPSPANAPRSR